MTNSELFKAAHALTKEVLQKEEGDNYSATFSLCLKKVIRDNKPKLSVIKAACEVWESTTIFFPIFLILSSFSLLAMGSSSEAVSTALYSVHALGSLVVLVSLVSLAIDEIKIDCYE